MKIRCILHYIMLMVFSHYLTACDPVGQAYYINNNSSSAVYVCISCDDTLPLHPLRLRMQIKGDSLTYPPYRVEAFSFKMLDRLPGTIERPIIGGSDSMLRLFFIKESVLSSNDWETIREKKLYEKMVRLTLADLKNNNWIYTYNPDE